MTGPCDWDIAPEDLCSGWESHPEPVRTAALELATGFLWARTGRRFGMCPVTVRPIQQQREDPSYRAYVVWPGQDPAVSGPYLYAGTWRNCGCGSGCCCRRECAVVLRGPVASVTSVMVDGEVIDPEFYRVDVARGAYWLMRLDGMCWPTCPSPDDEESFTVSYELGTELPASLRVATSVLACEYAKFLAGGDCRLPSRMTRLSRQGVDVEVVPADPGEGLTGISEVDDAISALNPSRRTRPPVILSPDLPESCDRVTVVHPGGS